MNMMRLFPNSNISKQIRQANQSEYKTLTKKQLNQGKKNKKHLVKSSRDLKTDQITTSQTIGIPTPTIHAESSNLGT